MKISEHPSVEIPGRTGVEEEVIAEEEYKLLEEALQTAERSVQSSISSYIDFEGDELVLCLRPRPRFENGLCHRLIELSLYPHFSSNSLLKFRLSAFDEARSLCAEHGACLSIPPSLVHCLASIPHDSVNVSEIAKRVPTLWNTLFPFQREGVSHIISRQGRVLLADDMGLGKTFQAMVAAEYLRSEYALVLCPATLREQWQMAIKKWLGKPVLQLSSAKQLSLFSLPSSRDPWDSSEKIAYVIASYDLLPKFGAHDLPSPSVIIADECHMLRNPNALRTKAAIPVILKAKHRILVTGTPALSKPSELYPVLRLALETTKNPFLSYSYFLRRYCGGELDTNRVACNVEELHAILSSIMIRRSKTDVAELPKKRRRRVEVEIPSERLNDIANMLRKVESIMDRMNHAAPHEIALLRSQKEMMYTTLTMRTADVKIPGVLLRIERLLQHRQTKVLVFAHHLNLLDASETLARRKNVEYIRIDGCTASNDRKMLVDRFQEEANVRLAILSLAVAGTGLTLTKADFVLFAELGWVPSLLVQAEDRAHRLGRSGEVMIEYVSARGTIDDLMWNVLASKASLINRAVDGAQKERMSTSDVSIMSDNPVFISTSDIQLFLAGNVLGEEAHQEERCKDCGEE